MRTRAMTSRELVICIQLDGGGERKGMFGIALGMVGIEGIVGRGFDGKGGSEGMVGSDGFGKGGNIGFGRVG